jgi:hypothetical protein
MCMPKMKTPVKPEPVAQALQTNKNAKVDIGPKKRKIAGKKIKKGNSRQRLVADNSNPAGINTASKGVGVYTGGGGGGAYS